MLLLLHPHTGCNVWEWTSNSIITHAVSSSPYGPYEQRDCAMETCLPEAHEGSVAVAPTGCAPAATSQICVLLQMQIAFATTGTLVDH